MSDECGYRRTSGRMNRAVVSPRSAILKFSTHAGIVFDPESVTRYKMFWGEATATMRSFRPGRIHFIYATPASNPVLAKMLSGIDDFGAFWREFLFQSCRVLHEHGSIVLPRPEWLTMAADIRGIMAGYGMLFHDDLPGMMHFTKLTSFYSGFESEPLQTEILPAGWNEFTPVSRMYDAFCCAYAPPGGIVMDPYTLRSSGMEPRVDFMRN